MYASIPIFSTRSTSPGRGPKPSRLRTWAAFWRSVNRLGQMDRIVMDFAVPLGIHPDVAQPIIGTQIDDANAPFEQGRHRRHADAMRQTTEDTLDAVPLEPIGVEMFEPQRDPSGQSWMQFRDERRTFLARSDGLNVHVRMSSRISSNSRAV